MPFWDDALNQAIGETIAGEFDMLLGRRTYEIFAAYWPNQGDNPIAKAFNKATKYVVTRSLDQLDWENSLHMGGDVVDEVRRLKASDGPALHIWGSSELLQTLIAVELVDEYRAGGLSVGRRRNAAVRKWRPAARPCPGRDAKHAQGRPHQHIPPGRFAPAGVIPS